MSRGSALVWALAQETAQEIVAETAEEGTSWAEIEQIANVPGINCATALMMAAVGGNLDVGRVLLAAGADIGCVDSNGFTAYMRATMGSHTEFAALLLSKGATPWDFLADGLPRQCQQIGFRRLLRSGTKLTALPESLGECKVLEKLILSGAFELPCLPSSIGGCSALRELWCRGCSALTSLPDSLGELQRLEMIDLTGCAALTSLPATLRKCTALRRVITDGCDALSEESCALVSSINS